ncbi:hypothetical protein BCE02nite_23050 [Brevibacillus centrosporus]|nr:hypothetical protein BCE02nite_23050 [Brevibacillus centrosporus]
MKSKREAALHLRRAASLFVILAAPYRSKSCKNATSVEENGHGFTGARDREIYPWFECGKIDRG